MDFSLRPFFLAFLVGHSLFRTWNLFPNRIGYRPHKASSTFVSIRYVILFPLIFSYDLYFILLYMD